MDRARFRQVAQSRLRDAKALAEARRYSGAYYLAGYSVECGLKACLSRQTRRSSFPTRQKGEDDPYTHDLAKLLRLSGLKSKHEAYLSANTNFQTYWNVVKDWKEDSRYARKSKSEALDLIKAVEDPIDGVMAWIVQYW